MKGLAFAYDPGTYVSSMIASLLALQDSMITKPHISSTLCPCSLVTIDGYSVEIIKRGGIDVGDARKD